MADVNEYIAALRTKRDFLSQQWTWLSQEGEQFDADIHRLRSLLSRTRRELAAYLLAEVEDPDITALQDRLQYPSLLPIKREFEARLEEGQQELTRLLQDEEVQHLAFHLSQSRDELAELQPAYQALYAADNTWRANRWLIDLETRGYFRPDYEPGFFGRFRDWKCVSLLIEDIEEALALELEDPEALRGAYNRHRSDADTVFEAWAYVSERLGKLESMEKRVAELQEQPQQLFQAMLAVLSEAVLDHLESCPEAMRIDLAKDDKHLVTFLNKMSGLEKQVQYLRELKTAQVDSRVQDVSRQLTKMGRKINKARRKPWAIAVSDSDVLKLRTLKTEKWNKRCTKVTKLRTRIGGFNKYKKGSFTSDYLWWDVMTGGARTQDVYEVVEFRRHHADWDHRTYHAPWHSPDDHGVDDAYDAASPALAAAMAADSLSDLDTDIS